jgi:hypothetical protein
MKNDLNVLKDVIDFCNVEKIPGGAANKLLWNGSYIMTTAWRWFPLGDDFVDFFEARDLDTCPSEREYVSVQVWLESNTLFHVMRGNNLISLRKKYLIFLKKYFIFMKITHGMILQYLQGFGVLLIKEIAHKRMNFSIYWLTNQLQKDTTCLVTNFTEEINHF